MAPHVGITGSEIPDRWTQATGLSGLKRPAFADADDFFIGGPAALLDELLLFPEKVRGSAIERFAGWSQCETGMGTDKEAAANLCFEMVDLLEHRLPAHIERIFGFGEAAAVSCGEEYADLILVHGRQPFVTTMVALSSFLRIAAGPRMFAAKRGETMKKQYVRSGMIAAALCLGLSGCGSAAASASASATAASLYTAGSYTSVQPGRNGDVSVTVTFSDNAIDDISVESKETQTIGVAAMDQLKDQVLKTQTIPSDAISGATISSNAFLAAVKNTVKQAGGDPDAMTAQASAATTNYETEADIIIVGGGAAGMSAAIAAHDEGASVILLEKSSVLGGNTVAAANGINAADSDVQLADEQYKASGASVAGLEKLQMNNSEARENLVDAFAENSGDTINWLSSLGVDFTVDIQKDDRNSDQNYYMLKADKDGSTAITMINAVTAALKDAGITVYYQMDATDLIQDSDGTVTGVKATDASGNEVDFTGKAVLLATGGFGQNSQLVAEVAPKLAGAVTDEVAPTTGEGLLMAQAIGADAVDLDAIQTFPAVIPGYGMILPMNLPGGFNPDALYINENGKRFAAEAFEIPDAILAQPEGKVYAIFTEANLNDFLSNLVDLGYVVSADSAKELGEKLGIDGDALQETIDNFNEDIKDGVDDEEGRTENLNPIEGKLYGYRFGVGAHYCMGGLLINEKTQVLDTDGNAIPGLYAAGEVTGGFHGTFRVDGSGLGDSFTFGRLAGKTIAESIK